MKREKERGRKGQVSICKFKSEVPCNLVVYVQCVQQVQELLFMKIELMWLTEISIVARGNDHPNGFKICRYILSRPFFFIIQST